MDENRINDVAVKICAGQIGVMPTDTIYGLVGLANNPKIIGRVYQAKGRGKHKPFIVLINSYKQLGGLSMKLNSIQKIKLEELWPGAVSVVLPCNDQSMEHLHRGLKSLAVRMPSPDWLKNLLSKTGPIVATSANLSGQTPLQDIAAIKNQLPGLDFYIAGKVGNTPSRVVGLESDGTIKEYRR